MNDQHPSAAPASWDPSARAVMPLVPPPPPRELPARLRRHIWWHELRKAAVVTIFIFLPVLTSGDLVLIALFIVLVVPAALFRPARRAWRRLYALQHGVATGGTLLEARQAQSVVELSFSFVDHRGMTLHGVDRCHGYPAPFVPNSGAWVVYVPLDASRSALWPPQEYAGWCYRNALTDGKIDRVARGEVATYGNMYPSDTQPPADVVRLFWWQGRWYGVDERGRCEIAAGAYDFVYMNGVILALRHDLIGTSSPGHLTLSWGRRVHYAGQAWFGTQHHDLGLLFAWGNRSGHYRPPAAFANVMPFPIEQFRGCIDGGSKQARRVQLPVFNMQ